MGRESTSPRSTVWGREGMFARIGHAPAMVPRAKSRRRRIVTNGKGHLVGSQIHTAGIQARVGVGQVIASVRGRCPSLCGLFGTQPQPACRPAGGLCS